MSAHTPGPWKVIPPVTNWQNSYIVTTKEEQYDVAVVTVRNIGNEDNEANARLIAAAPELLEALREIVAMTDEDAGTFRKRGGTYRGLVGIVAAAAIAKAEGRS